MLAHTIDPKMVRHAMALAEQKWGPECLQSLRGAFAELQQSAAEAYQHRPWHVIQFEPQHERKAAADCAAYGVKLYVPEEERLRTYGVRTSFGTYRGKRRVIVPMFPGYGFARLDLRPVDRFGRPADEATLRIIRRARGVRQGIHTFLHEGSHPAVIADWAMQLFQEREWDAYNPDKGPKASFAIGENVRVADGPFASFNAVVEEILKLDPVERIKVLVDIFGRKTPVTLEARQLDKL
jgi:transcription antitermination factor NusG